MKKLKNIALLLLLSVSAVVGVGTVKAEGFRATNLGIVCNPESIGKGNTAACYIVVQPDPQDSTTASLNGFVSAAFVTKELEITGANTNSKIENTGVAFNHATTHNGSDKFTGESMPSGIESIRCERSGEWIESAGRPEKVESDYACAVFYTKVGSSKNAYTPSSLRNDEELIDKIIPNLKASKYGIIGSYTVKLKDDATTSGDCGSICVKAWGIKDAADYDKIVMNGDASISDDLPQANACVEIHKQSTPTTHPGGTIVPDTGAFTSYIVLAASALIAIGAIAIAKKNNRFNKI